jgi:hypothetical protein
LTAPLLSINYVDIFTNSLPKTTFQNVTQQWSLFDNEENYLKHGNKSIPPESVSYKFNSLGYRCDEFNASNTGQTLFIGCSITMGEGMQYDSTWAYMLHRVIQRTDLSQNTFINMAAAGASWDYIARTLLQSVPILKPKRVLAYLPTISRRELLALDSNEYARPFNWVPSEKTTHPAFKACETLAITDEYTKYRYMMNLRTIEMVCRAYNVELIWACWDPNSARLPAGCQPEYGKRIMVPFPGGHGEGGFARDGSHPGFAAHRVIRDTFLAALT